MRMSQLAFLGNLVVYFKLYKRGPHKTEKHKTAKGQCHVLIFCIHILLCNFFSSFSILKNNNFHIWFLQIVRSGKSSLFLCI